MQDLHPASRESPSCCVKISGSRMQAIRAAYKRLPQALRLPVDLAHGTVHDTCRNWRLPAFQVASELAESGHRATITCYGYDPHYAEWIQGCLGTQPGRLAAGSASLPDILLDRGDVPRGDMVILPVNPLSRRFFTAAGWYAVPKYVDCIVDLNRPFRDLLRGKQARKEHSAFLRSPYHLTRLETEEDLREFYETVLKPTVRRRHKDLAYLSSWPDIYRSFMNGALFAVCEGGNMLVGRLVTFESSDTARLANVGWRNGDPEIMKQRLHIGSMYETVRLLQDQGFRRVNLGGNSPFANDGPLNFKLSRFHAEIVPPGIAYENRQLQGIRSTFAVRFRKDSEASKLILHNMPLLVQSGRGLKVLSCESPLRSEFRHQIDRGMQIVEL